MTSSSLYLEVEHCRAVCNELRTELAKAKADRIDLAREVDEANERVAAATEERDQLSVHYNDALRINAEQISMIERLKRQVNDQAQEIERLKSSKAGAA